MRHVLQSTAWDSSETNHSVKNAQVSKLTVYGTEWINLATALEFCVQGNPGRFLGTQRQDLLCSKAKCRLEEKSLLLVWTFNICNFWVHVLAQTGYCTTLQGLLEGLTQGRLFCHCGTSDVSYLHGHG